ncbi:AMSH-like ubiquitin thioesterase 2 isoform X3 [Durio zibethinus]|uniref:AMSH-like ubiquitin thioesterase 2 isoform X3 n=1 Tax=Durio zibethinus TaxID=66656 RepID=A0A6P5Y031_DURZI|nr:AMSH-like ubiquitin thioesterase 2 isoform X3 [Durio zibethinus]
MADDRFSQLTNNRYSQERSCGIAQTECQSLRIFIEEKVGLASCNELDSASSCLGHESLCPIPDQTITTCKLIKSARLMEDFLELAKDNTEKDLETCGVLGAFLEKGTFYVTTLIIPKQESTSNSCQAVNEEEIFAIQNDRSLFPVGWIHTHPSQSCFMSSIDLHTQYSYQVMVPEAFAIVVAPTDNSRSYGIFRVSDPSGMSVLKECQEKGSQFHSHKEPVSGSPIYEHCTHVYKNSNLRFEIFDLR